MSATCSVTTKLKKKVNNSVFSVTDFNSILQSQHFWKAGLIALNYQQYGCSLLFLLTSRAWKSRWILFSWNHKNSVFQKNPNGQKIIIWEYLSNVPFLYSDKFKEIMMNTLIFGVCPVKRGAGWWIPDYSFLTWTSPACVYSRNFAMETSTDYWVVTVLAVLHVFLLTLRRAVLVLTTARGWVTISHFTEGVCGFTSSLHQLGP